MTDQDLQQLRREKWRLDGKPIRTIEEARAFLEEVGFCLMYPKRPPLPVPTFIGAFVGSDDRLPGWQHAFKDPRAAEATELMVRLLRERTAFEANLFDENNGFLVAASVFPYFYALVGERNPKLAPKPGSRAPYSALACDAFELIRRDGPISKQKLQDALGGSVSLPALDGALGELWSKLRITRVDYKQSEGSVWDVLYRWAPDAVKEGVALSVPEALTALLSKYLDCVIAVEQADLEVFFGNFIARSKVKDAVNALLAARELSFVHVSGRSMLQITAESRAGSGSNSAPEAASKKMDWCQSIEETGLAILPGVFGHEFLDRLLEEIDEREPQRSRAGMRHALKLAPVAALAREPELIKIACGVLGREAFPFRATLFDKSPQSNWLVVWHQDTALPLRTRREQDGWGPWSVKAGIHYAHAPSSTLNQVLALRIHFDDSTASNGPLRVIPGTHGLGVLTDDGVHEIARKETPFDCLVPKGGVLAMRPLLIHASSKSRTETPRRVLHIEYAASAAIAQPFELVVA